MKYLLTLAIAALVASISAQDFYQMDAVQTIEVTFAESNWDQLMDAAYAADAGYILAQSVTINGVTMDSVGVKYKGNSSYRSSQVKNPWHIELDTYKDHAYDGYTDIKLANGNKDPSFIRDVLAYQVVRQYMEAPLANFANLYVNGELIGLYANTESVSKKFMNSRFGSKNNTRFKCSPPEGAGPQARNLPRLVHLGPDSTDYYDAYELKSDAGWQELIDLCDTLANHTADIEQILDVDRALWMLAFNNTIVNLDSYIGAFAQNYYLYRSDQGQFMPIVWDLNESFGGFSMTGTSSLNSTTAKQQMTHLLHENNDDYPLVQQLLAIPTYKRMYLAHMKTIVEENFDNGAYYDVAESLQVVIDEAVQADGNKFYTYANFLTSLDSDLTAGRDRIPGIASLMEGRAAYLLGLPDFSNAEPSIDDITLSDDVPSVGDVINITAAATEASTVMLSYRSTQGTAPFTTVEMFDDGAHGDGAAGDGVYGVELPISSDKVDYYIYAENDDIGLFSPRRAAHEYYTITATAITSTTGVVINEFMASNDATIADQDGEFDDWIELYNNDSIAVDLSGYYLTDDGTDLTQWTFPSGTIIESGDYLIIWADDDTDQAGLHATFKLSGSGESVILSGPDSMTIDAVDYPEQTTDVSYARIPNGTGDFQAAAPTFDDNNDNRADCTAAGGDADSDGVCADVDCDDNDASIGAMMAPGSACDDGDASTQNDVVLADGCTCEGTPTMLSNVVINEFMASNDVTVADQDGDFDDWIELYNNDDVEVDLSGYFFSDDADEVTKWEFPVGTSIAAGGYLIVWADEDLDQEGLHADFKLSGGGESVVLSTSDTTVIDALDYPEQNADISYGRFPNGTGDFQTMTPTFNAENTMSTAVADVVVRLEDVIVYPNPAIDYVTIEALSAETTDKTITVQDITGAVVHRGTLATRTTINTSNWPSGLYIVRVKGVSIKLFVL
jgi:hypothetical protein